MTASWNKPLQALPVCGLLAASLWLCLAAPQAHAVLPSVINAAHTAAPAEGPSSHAPLTNITPDYREAGGENEASSPASTAPLVIETLDDDVLKAAPDVTKTGTIIDTEKQLPVTAAQEPAETDPAEEALSRLDPKTRETLEKLTETLHLQHRAIYNELRDEEELATVDIAMLWQAAVERSGTIRYAIEKLSHTTATGEPVGEDSFTKRIMSGVAQLGGIAGSMWTGTPAGVIGGGLMNDLISGDPSVSAMTRVTDADMLILAKEVEALQSDLIRKYYQYRHAEEQWQLSREAHRTLSAYYEQVGATDDPAAGALKPVIDALYQDIRNEEDEARRTYISARNALSLLVGRDAIVALEKSRQTSLAH